MHHVLRDLQDFPLENLIYGLLAIVTAAGMINRVLHEFGGWAWKAWRRRRNGSSVVVGGDLAVALGAISVRLDGVERRLDQIEDILTRPRDLPYKRPRIEPKKGGA